MAAKISLLIPVRTEIDSFIRNLKEISSLSEKEENIEFLIEGYIKSTLK